MGSAVRPSSSRMSGGEAVQHRHLQRPSTPRRSGLRYCCAAARRLCHCRRRRGWPGASRRQRALHQVAGSSRRRPPPARACRLWRDPDAARPPFGRRDPALAGSLPATRSERQLEPEGAAQPGWLRTPIAPPMSSTALQQIDKVEPGAAEAARDAGVGLGERREQAPVPRARCRCRCPAPPHAHAQAAHPPFRPCAHAARRPRTLGELDRVADQVDQDLLDAQPACRAAGPAAALAVRCAARAPSRARLAHQGCRDWRAARGRSKGRGSMRSWPASILESRAITSLRIASSDCPAPRMRLTMSRLRGRERLAFRAPGETEHRVHGRMDLVVCVGEELLWRRWPRRLREAWRRRSSISMRAEMSPTMPGSAGTSSEATCTGAKARVHPHRRAVRTQVAFVQAVSRRCAWRPGGRAGAGSRRRPSGGERYRVGSRPARRRATDDLRRSAGWPLGDPAACAGRAAPPRQRRLLEDHLKRASAVWRACSGGALALLAVAPPPGSRRSIPGMRPSAITTPMPQVSVRMPA